ncbi:MAG: transporter substrate-binding domain-containing protein, partial [Clostridiales bacterium]|nr:transporter substrate-binding domain-containing protein [Candidatus Equinaster intestinalis]
MKKKLLTVILAVLLIAAVVAALIIIPKTRIADLFAEKVKVGVSDNTPYSFVAGGGDYSGFSADYIKKALEELGYKVIFVTAPADEQDKLLQSGEIDCYVDATSNEQENTFYTKDYISCVQGTFYKDKSIHLQSGTDIKDYRCAFIAGNNNSSYVKKNGGKAVPEGSAELCAKAVKEGKADICI